jgi:hypothetical protein
VIREVTVGTSGLAGAVSQNAVSEEYGHFKGFPTVRSVNCSVFPTNPQGNRTAFARVGGEVRKATRGSMLSLTTGAATVLDQGPLVDLESPILARE